MTREDGFHVTYGGDSVNVFTGSAAAANAAEYALNEPVRMSVEQWEDGARVAAWAPDEMHLDADGVAHLDPR